MTDQQIPMADGYTNLMSRLGTTADRSTATFYTVPFLDRTQIEAAYRTSWLTRKIHDLPPFEMTRARRSWNAKPEQITALEQYESRRRIDVWGKIRRALMLARLRGGAAMIMGFRDTDLSQPLDVDRVDKDGLRYLLVVSRHRVTFPAGFDYDLESDFYGQPKLYELKTGNGGSVRIHPSRVIPFHGSPLPEDSLTADETDAFWGDPLLQSIKSTIDNSESAQAAVASLLHELKQDVISVPGLLEKVATTDGENLLVRRLQLANTTRSLFNALLLDGGDDDGAGKESWETRQLSFAQHPELLRQFIAIVAGAADIPVTRLMGESPGGLNSTGKGEQADFNRMISAKRDAEIAPALAMLDEVLIRSALGARDPDITYTFGELDEPNETTESENDKRDAETLKIYADSGLIPQAALAKSAQNRMIESGRWPGLDQALKDDAAQADLPPDRGDPQPFGDAAPRSLYVRRDLLNIAEFGAWAKSQGLTAQDGLHVTIAYSRAAVDWIKAESDWTSDDDGSYTVAPGGPRVVERLGDKGAVVLLFASSHLSYRHERIRQGTGASHDFAEYTPHVTITFDAPADFDVDAVQPFRGALRFGPEIFEEVSAD